MKFATLLSTFIAVPMLAASGYTLVITHSNGTTTEIPTEEITNIEFRGDEQPPVTPPELTKLETPNMVLTPTGPDSYIIAWSKVDNAASYGWQVDGGEITYSTGTQSNITGLMAGTHIVSLRAYPAQGSDFAPSDPKEKTIEIDINVQTTVISTDKTSLKVSVSVNTTASVTFGIVPESVTGAAAQVEYVKSDAKAQKVVFNATPETAKTVDFTGLTADTSYNIVVFLTDDSSKMSASVVRTAKNLNPGDKATVFPPGVTAEKGWIDVDKVGNLSTYGWSGQDNLMCWACAISGMIQWWLNDYKIKTGHDYPLKYSIPTESKCYTTPVMDLFVDYYYLHEGGEMFDRIKWFFAPVPYNKLNEKGDKILDESLPNWKGGFAGMTDEEAQKLIVANAKSSDGWNVPRYEFNVGYEDFTTDAELAKVFSTKMINALHQGPVAVYIVTTGGSSVHGVSCWGADYEVLADGSYKINNLHISENDPLPGNLRNKLNPATITYEGGLVKIEMSTTGGKKNLNFFFGLRGYQEN